MLESAAKLHHKTFTVSSEALLALKASPITAIGAPGKGLYIEFVAAQIMLDYNSAAYVEPDDVTDPENPVPTTENLVFRFTDGSGVIVSQDIEFTGFLDQTAKTITNALPKKDAIV